MELDEMKLAWAKMDLRQDGLEALLRQDLRDRRMEKSRASMRRTLWWLGLEVTGWIVFVATSVEKMREDIRNVKDEGGREWQGQRVQVISWDIDTRVMLFKVKTHNLAFIDTQGRIIHTEAQSRRHGTTTRDIHYDDSIRVHAPS